MNNDYLPRLHEVEIEILNAIVEICKKNSIQYFLIGGSLIGAVRHNGFIPWDDDIDIGMLRKDYEKFLRIAIKELPKEYFLQCYLTDKEYIQSFAKVRKNGTVFQEGNNPKRLGTHLGIYVDIFPFDYAKKASGLQQIQKNVTNKLLAIQQIKYRYVYHGKIKQYIAALFPSKLNHYLQQRIMKLRKSGDFLVNLSSPYGVNRETIPASWILPLKEMQFGKEKYAIPGNYDAVLCQIFGDYLLLPPEEKRVAHSPIEINFDVSSDK